MKPGFDDIPQTALEWHLAGQGAVLATVVQTWGSAPRPVGSQMAVSGSGDIAGSVSGGCVEGAVVLEAGEALEKGRSVILEYGISDGQALSTGLACGGTIRVMVEPIGTGISQNMLSDLCAARAARTPVVYAVDTASWDRRLIAPGTVECTPEIAARVASDKSGFEGSEFVAVHNPRVRLAVVGAVHIAQPLLQMARLVGFDTILIDPREAFATPARFVGETIDNDWPDTALVRFGLDRRTAVVTLAHDPKLDDSAIIAALKSDAFYLGSLGSRRTHAKRIERLTEAGFDAEQLGRIHGPVGLKIGAMSPGEIAISIMAEITQRLRQG
jgi:xanthine dehydrogenase accessory factor